jgi:tRNA 2-thiouridine synthesizing protein D
MKYGLLVLGAPYSGNSSHTAYRFAKAALDAGHQVSRVFFYHDAVQNSNSLAVAPQGYLDLQAKWQALIQQHDIDIVTCIASALKRGVLNAQEARRHDKNCDNMVQNHDLSGLGQLIDVYSHADRIITFGK